MPDSIDYGDLYAQVDYISCTICGKEMKLSENNVLFCDHCKISLCNSCANKGCPRCKSMNGLMSLKPGLRKEPIGE